MQSATYMERLTCGWSNTCPLDIYLLYRSTLLVDGVTGVAFPGLTGCDTGLVSAQCALMMLIINFHCWRL